MVEFVYCPSTEDVFSSLIDALEFVASVASDLNDAIGWGIYVHEKISATHSQFISARDIVESMQNSACDVYSEFADDYLNDIEFNESKLKELDLLVTNFFNKNAEQPTFFMAGKKVNCIIVTKELLTEHNFKLGGEEQSHG